MAGNKIKQGQVIGLGEKIFNAVMVILGVLITFIALYPIYYVLISSFSKPFFVENGNVLLKIKEFTTASYEAVFKRDGLWTSYGNAIFYTVFGLMANMFFTTTMAYALSRKYLIGRKILTLFTVFTMWFSAGIIPTYMNFNNLGLLNTRTAIIFGFAIETYNLIIMKSFFEQVPEALEEAAFIDGAGHFRVFWNIYLPLSKPALATVGLFYGISRWNGYFWAMQLLKDDSKIPLQVFLKKLIVERVFNPSDAAIVTKASLTSPTTQVYALIILAIVPMIIVFPFIQKYFKSGLTVGGVKG
ncbi:carbohydrate ABC transporter permease [Blautia marasmi]|uniref:carbohydrate ABC transporter permease n=1 Tax=Blautia marasmi TaxID=1917868 RepID=UPI000CF21C0E|nr:carbohydrate ABC transporter permease [Blautia marasmi]